MTGAKRGRESGGNASGDDDTSSKRARAVGEDAGVAEGDAPTDNLPAQMKAEPKAELQEDDDDDDRIMMPTSTSRAVIKQGKECPYLDTISRQVWLRMNMHGHVGNLHGAACTLSSYQHRHADDRPVDMPIWYVARRLLHVTWP